MRHDDRYSMVSERCVHVMAQHGIRKWKELTVVNKKFQRLGIDLIGTVQFEAAGPVRVF